MSTAVVVFGFLILTGYLIISVSVLMASYNTRAKARSELEKEEMEPGDIAACSTTTTSSIPITTVGLYVESTRESGSMATETAGPTTTHPELLPAGDLPPVGGRGMLGSADSLRVGVSTLGYPSRHADPTDSTHSGVVESTSHVKVVSTPDIETVTTHYQLTPRQPPVAAAEAATAAAFSKSYIGPNVVDTPAHGRRRSSSAYTLSPPTLSPVYTSGQSQSVQVRIGRTASLQSRSQRSPSLSPTQWTGSYGNPSPPIGSDIESDFPAAKPSVYQPRLTEASQAPLQVDLRLSTLSDVSLAAEVQPSSSHAASTRTYTRADTPIPQSEMSQHGFEPMRVAQSLAGNVAPYPYASPSTSIDVLELASLPSTVAARHQMPAIVSRPSTVVGRRQSKSSVPIGISEPTLGPLRECQSGVTGSTSADLECQPYSYRGADVAEPRPTSIDTGHSLSRGVDVLRPSPTLVRPTPTSMVVGSLPTYVDYPSSIGAYVMSRPALADDESALRQPISAPIEQYTTVCTGLQVQTLDETLVAKSLLLLGRCPTSPSSSSHSSVHEWLQATGTHAPPPSPVESVSSSRSELEQVLAPRVEAPVVVPPSVRLSRTSRMSRTSRRSVASSLAMEIFSFSREMSGQVMAQAEAQRQDAQRREEV